MIEKKLFLTQVQCVPTNGTNVRGFHAIVNGILIVRLFQDRATIHYIVGELDYGGCRSFMSVSTTLIYLRTSFPILQTHTLKLNNALNGRNGHYVGFLSLTSSFQISKSRISKLRTSFSILQTHTLNLTMHLIDRTNITQAFSR